MGTTTREQDRDVAAAARRITKARCRARMIGEALERRRLRLGYEQGFAQLAAWEEEMAEYEGVAR